MSTLKEDRRLLALTQEGQLKLGGMSRMRGESVVEVLRRQKDAIIQAKAADDQAKRDATEAAKLRQQIRDLGHEPCA